MQEYGSWRLLVFYALRYIEESLFHLLFDCNFASVCWATVNLALPNSSEPVEILMRGQLCLPFSLETIITMCWSIWRVRNDAIFNNFPPSVNYRNTVFQHEFALVILRAKVKFHPHNEHLIARSCTWLPLFSWFFSSCLHPPQPAKPRILTVWCP